MGEQEALTGFVLDACLDKLGDAREWSCPDLFAPQVPVTELVRAHNDLQGAFEACAREGKAAATAAAAAQCFPRDADASFAAGVLWLHLKRRSPPLIPHRVFDKMLATAMELAPPGNCLLADGDPGLVVRQRIGLRELRDVLAHIPPACRKNLLKVLDFSARAIDASQALTSTSVRPVLAPILARPANTAFMSIRHRNDLMLVGPVVTALLDRLPSLTADFLSEKFVEADSGRPRASRGRAPRSPSLSPSKPAATTERSPLLRSPSLSPATVAKRHTPSEEASLGDSPRRAKGSLSVQTSDAESGGGSGSGGTCSSKTLLPAHMEVVNSLLKTQTQRLLCGDSGWMDFARRAARASAVPCALPLSPPYSPVKKAGRPQPGSGGGGGKGRPLSVRTGLQNNEPSAGESRVACEDACATNKRQQKPARPTTAEPAKAAPEGAEARTAAVQRSSSTGDLCVPERSNQDNDGAEGTEAAVSARLDRALDIHCEQRPRIGELELEKKKLKRELKAYDAEFQRSHGRAPGRMDKEPIRHMYERYNSIKRRIAIARAAAGEEACASPSRSSIGSSLSSEGSARGTRRRDAQPSAESLLNEKRALQARLREFERRFEETHKRQIRLPSDIRGHEDEYRRYKEVKAALAGLNLLQSPSSADSPRSLPSLFAGKTTFCR